MIVTIYTLPNCPVCEAVKEKLTENNISYLEKPFRDLPEFVYTDHAPVVDVGMHYLTSPTEIDKWIKGE